MMLNHIGQNKMAEKISNAWLTTIEQGIHTADIFKEGVSSKKVGTTEFADAVIANLGKKPEHLPVSSFPETKRFVLPEYKRKQLKSKKLVGVDLFVH